MSKTKRPAFNKPKFETVLLYILNECKDLPNVGKTVLFKLLYFIDFDSYELREKSITGETYCKLPRGPAPEHFESIITGLKKKNAIKEERILVGPDIEQHHFHALIKSDLKLLDGEELKIINNVIQKLSSMNARQISAYSHGDLPWRATPSNEVIDYNLVFYRDDTYSVRESDDSGDEAV